MSSDQSLKDSYLTSLELPVPDNFAEIFGYRGTTRYVCLYWTPFGNGAVL
jgi:hypothetical protein